MLKKMFFYYRWILIAFILGLIPIATPADDLETSKPRILKSASELEYPPFALVRPDGSADGFSVELLKAVVKEAGLKVDISVGPWHEIKQKLLDKKIDILPLVSYSKDRDRLFDFTAPYLRMHGTIFVRKGEKLIHTEADLQGREIITMRGDAAHEYVIRKNLSDKLILTDTFETALTILSQGKHDAVVVQQLVGLQSIKKLGISNLVDVTTLKETRLKPAGKPLSGFEQKFCIAVQEGDKELLSLLNEGLAIVFANGTYDYLYNKWFTPIFPNPPVPWTKILKYLLFILIPTLLMSAAAGIWLLRKQVKSKTLSLTSQIQERKQAEAMLQKAHEELEMRVYERTGELARANKLLDSLNAAQSMFISETNPKILFDKILQNILALTKSQYGFVGEVFFDEQGAPYLKIHAISDIAWDEKTKEYYELHAPTGMEFRNLKSLLGEILTSGQPVISNDPANDPRSCGLPEGHPPLDAFLGIPLYKGENLVGGIGIANRPRGYDEGLVNYLQPFFASCASIVEAYRSDQERKQAVEEVNRNYNIQSALSDILRTSLENIPLEEILSAILKKVLKVPWFAFEEQGSIFLVEDDPDILVLKAHNNFSAQHLETCGRIPAGKCHCGKAMLTKKIQFSSCIDEGHEIRYEGMPAHGDYCVPILLQDKVTGVLNVHVKDGHPYEKREADFLILVANTIAAIVVRKKAEESLKHYSEDLEEKVVMRTKEFKAAKLEAEAANIAKRDFLASMAHKLRTPLNAIIGFSQVLQARYFGALAEKQSEYVDDILESGHHLLSLINDILDLSKVEAGKMELALSRVNIKRLLENSLVMVKEKAHNHGIALELNVPDPLKKIKIDADERKLKQIMFNFLSNAAKFTPDGGKIEVSARLLDAQDKVVEPGTNEETFVEICVSDTGIGIATEDQARVFEPFIQVKGGITGKTAGTGLGLSLTKDFAALHKGRIWLESEGLGKGSRFFVRFPVQAARLDEESLKEDS